MPSTQKEDDVKLPFNKKENDIKYKREHIKRVPLDMQNSDYAALKKAAESVGEPVNTFVKKAIAERIQRLQHTDSGE